MTTMARVGDARLSHCSVCGAPAHASETDDLDRCANCRNADAARKAARLLAGHRAVNPASRATSLVRLVGNTGSTKQYGCVLCGAEGPTFSAKWAETKASRMWRDMHVAVHVANFESEMVALDAELEGRPDLAAKVRSSVTVRDVRDVLEGE